MTDAVFDHPRVAAVYDALDPDRSDLDAYTAMVTEFGGSRVLDIGCGTGTFATMLAARGVEVTGVDPAGASLDVARGKPHAESVTWIPGTAVDALPLQVDLVFMTANVAQVFVGDRAWADVLAVAHASLVPGGRLVFETRDPDRRAWERWTPELTRHVVDVSDEGPVEEWVEVVDVRDGCVTFESPTIFHRDGVRIDSTTTLRFRTRAELTASLRAAGFDVDEVRDAPDRPGAEFVFIARKVPAATDAAALTRLLRRRDAAGLFADLDPWGLVAIGAPRDEYTPEVDALLALTRPVTPDEVQATFTRMAQPVSDVDAFGLADAFNAVLARHPEPAT